MSAPAQRAVSPVRSAVLVAVALGLAGCVGATLKTAARDTMAKSSGCPADQVQVEELADARYRASGCQKTEMYVCKAAEHAVVSCVPESSVPPLGEPAR